MVTEGHGIREVTGYIAHALLGLHWLWVVPGTAPQMRRTMRCRGLRIRISLIRTAAVHHRSHAVTAMRSSPSS